MISRNSTPGCRSQKPFRIFGSHLTATLLKLAIRIVPASRPRSSCAFSCSLLSSSHTACTRGSSAAPSAVRVTPPLLRISRFSPSSFSSAATVWLTPDCVMFSSSAARVKLPSWADFRNTSYFVMLIPVTSFFKHSTGAPYPQVLFIVLMNIIQFSHGSNSAIIML